MSMSDRIAIMLDGHIEQLADPETVYERPASAFVAAFIGRNNFWRGTATGNGVVASDGTVFHATRPEERLANGDGALAAVRPECVKLVSAAPATNENQVEGTVASVAHFGDVLQYVVEAKGREVVVLAPRADGSARFKAGDAVWATWHADDVYQFSDRQADIVLADDAGILPSGDPANHTSEE